MLLFNLHEPCIGCYVACLLQDFEEGKGSLPQDGQQVTFDYTAYNESGARIDSTYQKGRPAQTRLGINGLIPGRFLYIVDMSAASRAQYVWLACDCKHDFLVEDHFRRIDSHVS